MSGNKKSTPHVLQHQVVFLLLSPCLLLVATGSVRADFVFGEPENLGPAVNSAYGDNSCDARSNGLELYIASDRPGGLGDTDLWVSKRLTANKDWGTAVNLGGPVNSPYQDAEPCISGDGLSLYFQSTRPGSLGGSDLYISTRATILDAWDEPVNLGPIVNSSAWDAGPSISADGLLLYFCSNREKIGTDYSELHYIYVTTRPTTDDPWSAPVRLGATVNPALAYSSAWPRISADGLSLYFWRMLSDARGQWVATRTSVTEPWNRVVDLGLRGASPWFSADGSIMTFVSRSYGGYGDVDVVQVSVDPIVDFNSDGAVDCIDICALVEHWGTDDSLYDIGPTPFGDGVVDVQDLIVLAEHISSDTGDSDDVE